MPAALCLKCLTWQPRYLFWVTYNIVIAILCVKGTNLSTLTPSHLLQFDGAFTIFYNASATYSIPMLINALTNSILSLQANKTGSTAQVISTTNLPWTADSGQNRFNNGAFSSIILIGMAFIAVAPTFAVYMVKDREVNLSEKWGMLPLKLKL